MEVSHSSDLSNISTLKWFPAPFPGRIRPSDEFILEALGVLF